MNGVPVGNIARLWGEDFPPVLKSIARDGVDVSLTWRTIPNRSYRVQYADDLATSDGGIWLGVLARRTSR